MFQGDEDFGWHHELIVIKSRFKKRMYHVLMHIKISKRR